MAERVVLNCKDHCSWNKLPGLLHGYNPILNTIEYYFFKNVTFTKVLTLMDIECVENCDTHFTTQTWNIHGACFLVQMHASNVYYRYLHEHACIN